MRQDMSRSERTAACLDEMKQVTPSRATVEYAIARARAQQASKKKKQASPRKLAPPIIVTKNQSSREPDPPSRSVDWKPEPSVAPKKPSSPTQAFFQNVFASRSTVSPTHGSRARNSAHSSRMADPPTSSDAASASVDAPVDAPAPVIAAASQDEEREDGDTFDAAPRSSKEEGETSETFQAEKFELESVAETKECDFGLEMRNLPTSPSMKSDSEADEKEENWDLQGMASEETMKATGNSRRTRPHKGIFVRKGKKKKSYDEEDGKVIRSLFSVDSSVAPVDALFDQESCFFDDEEDDDVDFDEDVSVEEPRKADPPDSSPIDDVEEPVDVEEKDVDAAKDVTAVPKEEGEANNDSETEEIEVPWDKKGTSLGDMLKLVESIKAKKAEDEEEAFSKKTEDISNTLTENHEKSVEYEDFVGDFLQSGSGDDAPHPVDKVAKSNGALTEGIAGEAENDSLIVDEIEKSGSQNAFIEQFEALGIEEESPQKKIAFDESENDKNLESEDAIMEWRTEDEIATESISDSIMEDAKPKNHVASLGEVRASDNGAECVPKTIDGSQTKDSICNTTEESDEEAIRDSLTRPEVETVHSTEHSVDKDESKTENESISECGVEEGAIKSSLMDDDTVSNASAEDGSIGDSQGDEDVNEDIPEEPIHIFKFAKGISEDVWQEKNEMASEWQHQSSSMPLDGVTAAENIYRFTNILDKEPEPRPWNVSCKRRTRNHQGFKRIDIYSVLESTKVTISEQTHDDYIPWEHRDVKQLFLHERSVEFSRNWYGQNLKLEVNFKFKLPVCQPRSMEMPLGTTEDAAEWNKDVYTTWKSPYQKVEHQRLKINKSEDDEEKTKDSEKSEMSHDAQPQSHVVKTSRSKDDDDEHSQASECDDEGSYSDGSYSDGSYTDSEGSYDYDDGSFSGSEISGAGSAVVIEDNNTLASFEDAPECGQIVNMRLKIGEHITRVHPAYTSSLRRSRWRKKYFPKGSFPY